MKIIFFLLTLLLSTQLGRHFWPSFAYIQGIRVDYLSPTIYLTDIIATWLIVTWLSKQFSIFTPEGPSFASFQFSIFRKYWLLVVFVVLVTLVVSFGSKSPLNGIYGLIRIVEFILLSLITAKAVKTKNDFGNVVNLLTVGLVFQSALAIIQFVKQGSVGGVLWFFGERTFTGSTVGIANAVVDGQLLLRPYGTFPHPNVLAGFLVIVMTLINSKFKIQNSKLGKTLIAFSLIIGTLALILTMSRVAILAWLLVLGSWFMVYFKKNKFTVYYLLFTVFIIVSIFYLVFPRFANFSLTDETVVRRQELAAAAVKMIKSSPLFGVGINNFLVNLPTFQQTKSTVLYLQPVHNIYLLITAETGVFGLLFFLWFIGKTYRNFKSGLLITLTVILFLGFFDHYFLTLQQGQLLFALTLGLCWSTIKERKR